MNHFDPGEATQMEKIVPRRVQTYKRPWHRQGWVWMIVVLIALIAVITAIGALSGQIANVNDAIREQTKELHQQNHILATIVHGIQRIETAITNGIDRIINAIGNLNS